MRRREHWYTVKAIQRPRQDDATRAMSDETQRSAVNVVFRKLGLKWQRKTHAARASAAMMAELGGAPESSIRRAGHWRRGDALTHNYLTHLSHDVLRVLAGWSVHGTHDDDYVIDRDLPPPKGLLKQVFPWVSKWCAVCFDQEGVQRR